MGGNPLNLQPGWHGRSAQGMKHHRRDALDVSHLSEEEQRRALVEEAGRLANDAKNQPQSNPYPEGKHRLKTACAGTRRQAPRGRPVAEMLPLAGVIAHH
ncbi:hypothetical protein MIU24_26585 [Streptomyces venezuelae]|uniref:hypothetical protein n=1 Tax=Streptomyces sp. B6(2022) TaxID=3404749 RepID=UPI00311E7066